METYRRVEDWVCPKCGSDDLVGHRDDLSIENKRCRQHGLGVVPVKRDRKASVRYWRSVGRHWRKKLNARLI